MSPVAGATRFPSGSLRDRSGEHASHAGRAAVRTVCMFSALFPPVYSGSSLQCSQLATTLVKQGWNVVVVAARSSAESPAFEVVGGVHVFRLPAIRLPRLPVALNFPWLFLTFSPSNLRRIRAILAQYSPAVIHLHNHMFDIALLAVTAARALRMPLVVTIHTMLRHPSPLYDLFLRAVDRLLLKELVVRRASAVICPDRIIERYVESTFAPGKSWLIPYGIHSDVVPQPTNIASLRGRLDIKDGPVILSVGHLHATRNRRELIQILPDLVRHFPNLKLILVGDVGTQTPARLADYLGVSRHLVLTGSVPHDQISTYLGIADLEAHWFDPSHPHKSPGIASQEAMAAGKVVVTVADPDVYGVGILRDGENIVLADLGDLPGLTRRLIELLADEDLRHRIGSRARETIERHFSWASVCRQTAAVYAEVVQEHANCFTSARHQNESGTRL